MSGRKINTRFTWNSPEWQEGEDGLEHSENWSCQNFLQLASYFVFIIVNECY